MLQNSIYVRSCVTYDKTEAYVKTLKLIAPTNGSVLVFYITDRQWGLSVNIERNGYMKSRYRKNPDEDGEKQLAFW
jgi:CRISPR/Cas system-associated protein endoribonuclease Cas2